MNEAQSTWTNVVLPELCASPNGDVDSGIRSDMDADGDGGNTAGMPNLNLLFPVGEYWQITQTYNPSNDLSSVIKITAAPTVTTVTRWIWLRKL